jgi:hypothetical protein
MPLGLGKAGLSDTHVLSMGEVCNWTHRSGASHKGKNTEGPQVNLGLQMVPRQGEGNTKWWKVPGTGKREGSTEKGMAIEASPEVKDLQTMSRSRGTRRHLERTAPGTKRRWLRGWGPQLGPQVEVGKMSETPWIVPPCHLTTLQSPPGCMAFGPNTSLSASRSFVTRLSTGTWPRRP